LKTIIYPVLLLGASVTNVKEVGGVKIVGTVSMVVTVEKAVELVGTTVGTVECVVGLVESWKHYKER
jgi:hypothetical protein